MRVCVDQTIHIGRPLCTAPIKSGSIYILLYIWSYLKLVFIHWKVFKRGIH